MTPATETLLALHRQVLDAVGTKESGAKAKEFDGFYKRVGNREQSEFHWRLAGRCPGEYGSVHLTGCGCGERI